ncbi:MAG: glutathione binding-like protein [Pseudomonadota bacterium]
MEVFYAKTNGMKPLLFLSEHEIPAKLTFVDVKNREQFSENFLKISPNNKIPAIKDGDLTIFESGGILEYFADRFLDFRDHPDRYAILQWLYWQVGGLAPMGGQNHFFREFAPEAIHFAIERYTQECNRLYGVLDRHLANHEFVSGDEYHIADMAIYPWVWYYELHHIDLKQYGHVRRWFERLSRRPSIEQVYRDYMAES